MKTRNIIITTLSAAALLISMSLTGCKGPAGKDGIAGKDANETCKQCHNLTIVDAKATEYEVSKHSWGEAALEEAGNTSCAPCHESEGFKYVCANNTPTAFVAPVAPATTWTNPYASSATTAFGEIGCFTCHSNLHTTYASSDFLPLTTTAAVPMTMWGGSKTINLTQDGGKSNLCVKCHQPRPFTNSATDRNLLDYADLKNNPTQDFYGGTATVTVLKPGYRTHTHYGTVGAIFAGMGGIEFAGTEPYTSSAHTTVASCTNCHMASMTGAAGGHTFKAKGNFNGCNVSGCHTTMSATSTDFTANRADIKAKLESLASKLKLTINGVDIGIMNKNGDATTNLWYGLVAGNYDGYLNIYDPINNPTGPNYNTTQFKNPTTTNWTQAQKDFNNTLPAITLTKGQMGAIINFQLCLREYSLGIHNYQYTKALLANTIAMLP